MDAKVKPSGENLVEEGVPNIVLSTGVVLKPRAIPPYVYVRVSTKDPMPDAPRSKVKNKDFYLENTDDETYIKKVQQWELEQNDRMLNAMVSYGIEEIVSVPKDMETYKKDRWLTKLAHTGIEVYPDDLDWRMTFWILTVAAVDAEDFNAIFAGVGRLSGVPEEDVQNAAKFS